MSKADPTIEIQKISGVLSNFDWKVVKQEITDQDATLTITKVLSPLPEDSKHAAD